MNDSASAAQQDGGPGSGFEKLGHAKEQNTQSVDRYGRPSVSFHGQKIKLTPPKTFQALIRIYCSTVIHTALADFHCFAKNHARMTGTSVLRRPIHGTGRRINDLKA